ncbi:MAG: DNA polymerase III subunit gamma/tau [Lachnospiraceae bacterium]|nr:DNA polymerase III subunit gamma/tau [Lachnospiraceae bacterium]
MSYQALYRKFRPVAFEDVKGQDAIVETLKNQITADRVGHAYLFCGTRGTGKTTIAKIFAKAVNCEAPENGSPCGKCKSCQAIASGASMNVIEIDAASNNGVDNIRGIVEEVSYSPAQGKYKVYIIDEVHMLSIGAFNALLKTLEEPPGYVIFILATTEVHKIPITILSRCQRYDFRRIDIDTITDRMTELMEQEKVSVEPKALRYIAKIADGSLRDALSLLDQCIAFHFGKELTYDMVLDVLGAVDNEVFSRLLRHMLSEDVLSCIELLEEIVIQGRELTQFVSDYTWYLRNLLLVKNCGAAEEVLDVSSEHLQLLKEEADMADQNTIMRFIRIFSELSGQIRYASAKRVMIEMTMIKACRPQMEKNRESIVERLRVLEDKIEKGLVAADVGPGNVQGDNYVISGNAGGEKSSLPPMPKAIPEDVEQIVKQWPLILNDCPNPMKGYLKTARLSLGSDNRLQIYLVEGTYSDYFLKVPEHMEQVALMLSNTIGKEVEPEFKTYGQNENFEAKNIDLSKIIMMDIEEEED